MNNSKKAFLSGLAAVLIWSTVASAFKISLRHLDPLQLLLCASAASIFVLFAVLAVQGKLSTLRMKRSELLRCVALGIINPFLYYFVLFKAYALLPAQEAQPLNYTWAITLSLLSIPLLGQTVNLLELLAIMVSYLGVVIISTHGDIMAMEFSNGPGVMLALGSTILWALYWIYNTRAKCDPVAGLLVNFLAGFPCILVAVLLLSELPTLTMPAILGSAYVGLFEMGIAFVLWLTAMKHAAMPDGGGTARIANLIFLSPFLSLVFIYFLVGETILPSTIAGLVLIMLGNGLMQWAGKRS